MNELRPIEARSIQFGMAGKAAKGFLVAQPKLGYRIQRTDDGTLPKLDGDLSGPLRQAFGLAAQGDSLRRVTAWLREQGVLGRRGELVSLATVQRMLTDPFYAGLVQRDGQWGDGVHEPLVDGKTFRAVQRQLARRRYS